MGLRMLVLCVGLVSLGGCAVQQSQQAMQAKESLVGSTKEQILACMGAPVASRTEGSTEVWTYQAGGNSVGIFSGNVAHVAHQGCTANVIMTGARVVRVNYSGNTGGLLTPGRACYQLVENCLPK